MTASRYYLGSHQPYRYIRDDTANLPHGAALEIVVTDADKKAVIVEELLRDDQRLDLAKRVFENLCGLFPERTIMLVHPGGHILKRSHKIAN